MTASALPMEAGFRFFSPLEAQPADALLGLIGLYRADPRPDKIDLGVGVYRDLSGATPVMRCVKEAEDILLGEQTTKSYLGAEGDVRYTELLAEVLLGPGAGDQGLVGVQTPGGTGALRLGAELLKRAAPRARVWIGTPTWPNHGPIFAEAGIEVRAHRFYDTATSMIDFDAMWEDLESALPGDILLVHGCCHNPTGSDFTEAQWALLAERCAARDLVPFIDLAYQGLGDGLDEDAAATRTLLDRLPTAIVAYSCDKNFGLYRERVGALWVKPSIADATDVIRGNMLVLARSLWSMPPDHGAAIVRTVLSHEELRRDWLVELDEMRHRLNGLRTALADAHPALAPIGKQRGMFAMLPISPASVPDLRERHGIYMAGNGRINIAGLTPATVPTLVAALSPHF